MGPRFLIDTNSAIDLIGGKLPLASRQWLQAVISAEQYAISFVNRIELLSPQMTLVEVMPFEEFIDAATVYGISEDIIQEAIRIRRLHRCKLPDAVIAATAFVQNLILVTRDTGFRTIAGLHVLDPHDAANLPALL